MGDRAVRSRAAQGLRVARDPLDGAPPAIFQDRFKQYLEPEPRDAYRAFRSHPAYELTMRFTAEYDEPSFDPTYDTLPIGAFADAARRVFACARYA